MIIARTRRWGSSIGVVLPKVEIERLKIGEDEEIFLEVRKKENPLIELFGSGKNNKIGVAELKKLRRGWESKY